MLHNLRLNNKSQSKVLSSLRRIISHKCLCLIRNLKSYLKSSQNQNEIFELCYLKHNIYIFLIWHKTQQNSLVRLSRKFLEPTLNTLKVTLYKFLVLSKVDETNELAFAMQMSILIIWSFILHSIFNLKIFNLTITSIKRWVWH